MPKEDSSGRLPSIFQSLQCVEVDLFQLFDPIFRAEGHYLGTEAQYPLVQFIGWVNLDAVAFPTRVRWFHIFEGLLRSVYGLAVQVVRKQGRRCPMKLPDPL